MSTQTADPAAITAQAHAADVRKAWGRGGAAHPADGSWSDALLVSAVRRGDLAAFAGLYRRHLAVAGYVARAECDTGNDPDDVVAEAFGSVFGSLAKGGGPRESFQAYLTTTVRRIAHRRNIQGRRRATLGYGSAMDSLVLSEDSTIKAFESTTLMRAFHSLPVRWQAVLWCVEVEGLKPAATARVMELSPNGVSSLLIRAREGLRQAYLQQHVKVSPDDPCIDFSRHLGKFVRNAVRRAARQRLDHHVAVCRRCHEALQDLKEIHEAMAGD
jgi:RNA polymerase sigma factor (sigma-70 family)